MQPKADHGRNRRQNAGAFKMSRAYAVWKIRLAKNSRSTVAELGLLVYEYDCTPAYN